MQFCLIQMTQKWITLLVESLLVPSTDTLTKNSIEIFPKSDVQVHFQLKKKKIHFQHFSNKTLSYTLKKIKMNGESRE